MDDRRFDSLTRSLATGLSRRKTLKMLFGGAVLGGAAATHLDQVAAQCPEGQFYCNDGCCPNANNCCGDTTCCPPDLCNQQEGICCSETQFACGTGDNACCDLSDNCCGGTTCCPPGQCNQDTGTCCTDSQFACGTGDNACCDTQTEKCCDGVCIPAGDCCASLPDCAQGLLCCQGVCQECCSTDDCDPCEQCIDGGACAPLACEDPCEYCDPGADQCVPTCPENQHCCVSGSSPNAIVTCVDGSECCETDQCGECATCVNGYCQPDALPCPEGQVACCNGNELFCTECCHDTHCGTCHLCHQGRCVPCEAGGLICCDDACVDQGTCCTPFGDACGVLEVTSAGGDWPAQLDCCDGLVCCQSDYGSVCAECCTDHECPKGSICCAGQCRAMECCTDDVLIGLDPNRRCADGCSCFEGICECHCQSDNDCAWGTCCCDDGTCSADCCNYGCQHDTDCASGTCCCHDGSCSAQCCKTPPPTILPNTGSGRDGGRGSSTLGTAALGALAAYYAARKLREQQPDESIAEE